MLADGLADKSASPWRQRAARPRQTDNEAEAGLWTCGRCARAHRPPPWTTLQSCPQRPPSTTCPQPPTTTFIPFKRKDKRRHHVQGTARQQGSEETQEFPGTARTHGEGRDAAGGRRACARTRQRTQVGRPRATQASRGTICPPPSRHRAGGQLDHEAAAGTQAGAARADAAAVRGDQFSHHHQSQAQAAAFVVCGVPVLHKGLEHPRQRLP